MKDFIEKYKKEKIISNVSVIGISLVLAFGINFFILDGTDMGKNFKASILDVNNVQVNADFYIENNGNNIIVKSSKQILEPTNISLGISYNPDILFVEELKTNLGELAILGEEHTGNDTVLINMNGMNDVPVGSTILEIDTSRKVEQSTQVNMVNANFIDISGTQYNLTTSGITF